MQYNINATDMKNTKLLSLEPCDCLSQSLAYGYLLFLSSTSHKCSHIHTHTYTLTYIQTPSHTTTQLLHCTLCTDRSTGDSWAWSFLLVSYVSKHDFRLLVTFPNPTCHHPALSSLNFRHSFFSMSSWVHHGIWLVPAADFILFTNWL